MSRRPSPKRGLDTDLVDFIGNLVVAAGGGFIIFAVIITWKDFSPSNLLVLLEGLIGLIRSIV